MAATRFSIRHQLLLLGALATASIWMGALLQYVQLRSQSHELSAVRVGLSESARYAEAARMAAEERGLTNGWLLRPGGTGPTELLSARSRFDGRLAALTAAGVAGGPAAMPSTVGARIDQLAQLRNRVDRRDIVPADSFVAYSALVAVIQDASAQRLAAAMIAVGLPYEHANHLQRLAELLAQLRGQTNGALQSGTLSPDMGAAVSRLLVLYEETQRLCQSSASDSARARLGPVFADPSITATVDDARLLVTLHRVDALHLDAGAWWTLATTAVNTVQRASQRESAVVAGQADARIADLQRRMRWTVAALVVLGVVTLAMVFSTVGRIVSGLGRLIDGLDAVGSRRNFKARIDAGGRDEFAAISGSINKLIAIAGSVVAEQEALSQTDALTGAMNRRGFDQQIAARTTAMRAHTAPLCVVLVDVDHFKSVNDQLGHGVGDAVLRGMVQALRAALRPDDVLARFGGEEFVVLLPGCALAQALRVADNLRRAVEAHDHGIGRLVTASFGVAEWSRGQAPDSVLAAADVQLYAAKAAGRNRVSPAVLASVAA